MLLFLSNIHQKKKKKKTYDGFFWQSKIVWTYQYRYDGKCIPASWTWISSGQKTKNCRTAWGRLNEQGLL